MNDNQSREAEEWRTVARYPVYEISNLGNVRRDGRLLKVYTKALYPLVNLSMNNVQTTERIHRLMAEAFIPNPENKRTVNHIDGDKHNNSLDNLEWCTHSENSRHAYHNGICEAVNGENHCNAKLKDAEVKKIKEMLSEGVAQNKIAYLFGVTPSAIQQIKNGDTWKRVN